MKYMIQCNTANEGKTWERSTLYTLDYAYPDAARLVARLACVGLKYRIKPIPTHKPYRRRAAITPLELRGAISMLESASKHVLTREDNDTFEAWTILIGARMVVTRELESV